MRNLLKANFSRLLKSRIFYLLLVYAAGLSAFICWNQWDDMNKFDHVITVDSVLFVGLTLFGVAVAIFVSLFVGVEYSDGTIRNKLLVGRKRTDVYLANFIVSAAALALAYVLATAVMLGLGTLLLEPSVVPAKALWCAFGMGFFMVLAYAAIYNFIAMLLSNKTYTAILTIMLAFGLMICATFVMNRLDQRETVQQLAPVAEVSAEFAADENTEINAVMVGEDGALKAMAMETVPNPRYLTGAARERFQFFLDMNPAGQCIELAGLNMPHMVRIVLLDLGIVLAFGLGGVLLFRRKDIK